VWFAVAADAEPDQLFRFELRRDGTLVEAEQFAVKRARLVAAAGRDRDRDVLQLQAYGCMQSDCPYTTRLPVHEARPMRRHHTGCPHMLALRSASARRRFLVNGWGVFTSRARAAG
jgi:hypothetical protein